MGKIKQEWMRLTEELGMDEEYTQEEMMQMWGLEDLIQIDKLKTDIKEAKYRLTIAENADSFTAQMNREIDQATKDIRVAEDKLTALGVKDAYRVKYEE